MDLPRIATSIQSQMKRDGFVDQTFLTPEQYQTQDSPFSGLLADLTKLELQKLELLQKRTEVHPDVIKLTEQIMRVKSELTKFSCRSVVYTPNRRTEPKKENSLIFATNPLGLRWDAAVSKDGTMSMDQMPVNMDWNTFWEVKASYVDKGWYFEMQIPISSLRFQDFDGVTVMGISVFRWIPAKNEGDISKQQIFWVFLCLVSIFR